jgi:hypothetical protein
MPHFTMIRPCACLMFLVAIAALTSCSNSYYPTAMPNVPVFKEKGEIHAQGAYTITDKQGAELQAGYALTNHIAVIGNMNISSYPDNSTGGLTQAWEAGAGYYRPLNVNTKHAKNLFVFECYGVLGYGRTRTYYPDNNTDWVRRAGPVAQYPYQNYLFPVVPLTYPNNSITVNYLKQYVQPSISFSHNIFDFIAAAKIGVLETFSVKSTIPANALGEDPIDLLNYNTNDGSPAATWLALNGPRASFVVEPAVAVRIGFKYVKMQLEYTYMYLTNQHLSSLSCYMSFGMGLSVDIGQRFKKQKKEVQPVKIL